MNPEGAMIMAAAPMYLALIPVTYVIFCYLRLKQRNIEEDGLEKLT